MTDVNPVRSDNCRQYNNVPPQIDLPAMDHEIIDLWARQHTFDKSLEATKDGQPWTSFEGPPTANGQPGTHHVEARVFKDIFPRFKTMQGFRVDRKAGWDCHGLPVELAVEKELGFSGKPDIEKYGVEPFNAKCRESVTRHVDAFSELTERMGYWVNMDEAYWTMSPSYVESVWWGLKRIWDKGLLGEDHLEWIPKPSMGGEDFAVYLNHIPGAMFRLGCAGKSVGSALLHTPDFDVDEQALAVGAKVLARTVVLWSAP